MQNTQVPVTQPLTNNAQRAIDITQFMNAQKEPVYTMPISVKPKTREPAAFTDNRIYVSNIPFSFREQDLASMFFPYGRVLSVEIVTNDRGSKGFGFVTLDSIESCERARAALHESHVQGRIIEVRRATPTRRKITNNPLNEMLPPPKLCVDLRAPHNQWRTEQQDVENFRFPAAGFMMAPFHDTSLFAPNLGRIPFGDLSAVNLPLRCMKHTELKLSSNGDYFCKNGEPTTETSLLMCLNGQNKNGTGSKTCDTTKNESSDLNVDLNSVFPTHLREQITALLDTSNQFGSNTSGTQVRRAPSVESSDSRGRTSESEPNSDEEQWTPNHSPDLLAALYEGSTSFPGTASSAGPVAK